MNEQAAQKAIQLNVARVAAVTIACGETEFPALSFTCVKMKLTRTFTIIIDNKIVGITNTALRCNSLFRKYAMVGSTLSFIKNDSSNKLQYKHSNKGNRINWCKP